MNSRAILDDVNFVYIIVGACKGFPQLPVVFSYLSYQTSIFYKNDVIFKLLWLVTSPICLFISDDILEADVLLWGLKEKWEH